ncbi:Lipoyl synthase [Desulfocurvibacter africanus subsp. africanus str. Walvis Bay]|uniref:Lipoyl synthase n=1 Tax=Desulfocurvibacter africanus subsp. africanus str. Walvis Bay TaxID=690850 RepID=F3Z3Y9_DESAF|nr:Lipoyl synthase [Desulfocurvibacter africanus subsp. africanus str. Walvis Bay]
MRIPPWLRIELPRGKGFSCTGALLGDLRLNTVCRSARCPNIFECYSRKVATFLILGAQCTRGCAFCNIGLGRPEPVDPDEPARVSEAVGRLELRHAVITSVTRDDLPDGGSTHFAAVLRRIRADHPQVSTEVLIPDFQGDRQALETVLAAEPGILNHNVETAPGLYPRIRPQAVYARSLELLRTAKELAQEASTKSGLMVGLGETDEEVRGVIRDLHAAACDIVTVGQYMRPSRKHPEVERYVHPDTFEEYAAYGRSLGVPHMFCAPLVRSSYNAELFARKETGA